MIVTDEMVEKAAVAVARYMYNDEFLTDSVYKGDVRKFGDTVEQDFIGIARAALEGAFRASEQSARIK